jgi:hypothetical protein
MEGAPSTGELLVMAALLVGGVVLMLIAWRLVTGYARGTWNGLVTPSRWRLVWALACATGGTILLLLLWRNLDHIAARMGIGVLLLLVLLVDEGRGSRQRRRR